MARAKTFLSAASIVLAVCGCATLPEDLAEEYGIVEAHSTEVLKLGRFSYLSAGSYVLGRERKKPAFDLAGVARSAGGSRHKADGELYISRALQGKEIDFHYLLGQLSELESVVPRYSGYEFPARGLVAYLADPSERTSYRATSLSMTGKHRVALVVSFDPRNGDSAARSMVRTFAHELLHLTLRLHRVRLSRAKEEQAAISLEYCSELDIFGDVHAPQITRSIHTNASPVGTSVATRYVADHELVDAFSGQARISGERGAALRRLCKRRIAGLLEATGH